MDTPVDRLKHFAATLDMPINQLEKECGMPRSVGTKIKATSRPLMFEKKSVSASRFSYRVGENGRGRYASARTSCNHR